MTDNTRFIGNRAVNQTVTMWLLALGVFTVALLIVGFSGLATGVGNL